MEVERRAFEFHDPFVIEDLGPETFTRPRTFQEPRGETRKDFDLRFLQAAAPRPSVVWARGPQWPGHYAPQLTGRERFPVSPSNALPQGVNLVGGPLPVVPAY
jgi:hypothetical protein